MEEQKRMTELVAVKIKKEDAIDKLSKQGRGKGIEMREGRNERKINLGTRRGEKNIQKKKASKSMSLVNI